jgi:hypothetical protein
MVVRECRGERGNTASKYGRKPPDSEVEIEEVFCGISMPYLM